MNQKEFYKFKQSIIAEFRFLRKRISSDEYTTIRIEIRGKSIVLLSVGNHYVYCICDQCFNQLMCNIRETVAKVPNRNVNRCMFYREEFIELLKIQREYEMNKLEGMKDGICQGSDG